MIEVKNLTKKYGNKIVLNNLSFNVKQGEVVGFLGPNGAGKTTTIKMLTGFLPATAGHIKICGYDVLEDPNSVHQSLGYLPENNPVYPAMRVCEYLKFIAKLKGVSFRKVSSHVAEIVDQCDLEDYRKAIIKNLSKGCRQRLGLAVALVGNPDVLILDEPTAGLDPYQVVQFRKIIERLSDKHAMLISSHILSEIELISNLIVIINDGELVVKGNTAELLDNMASGGTVYLEIRVSAGEDVKMELEKLDDIIRVNSLDSFSNGWVALECEVGHFDQSREALFELITSKKWVLRELRSSRHTLENLFLEMTKEKIV
jgi:ABC-2 type transport system ATP-binding protein